MTVDLAAAADFMAGSARLLDRRRFDLLVGDGDPAAVLAAVEPYRNPDGGYGWGLEPDLRSRTSQPGGALHAFEVFADVGAASADRAVALCDWLAAVSLPDGGLPFALPVPDPAACAPFWAGADPTQPSLQITSIVVAAALRVAAVVPEVARHPWLDRASSFCVTTVRRMDVAPHAMELAFAVQGLDAIARHVPDAADALDRVAPWIPAEGRLHVDGGADDEFMRPLDFAPLPGGHARSLFAPDVVTAELEALAQGQRPDGGWAVDFASYSPAAAMEWRGYRTVEALALLRANGVL